MEVQAVTKAILVVDDNRLLRRLYVNCLEGLGHTAIEAEQPEDVIELIRDYDPDLVVMDIVMPGMSGMEVIQEIRSHDDLKNLIVVAVTTLGSDDDGNRFLQAGFNDYLGKPVHIKDFRALIEKHLGSS
jgi:CheY-like chemotaxis protein